MAVSASAQAIPAVVGHEPNVKPPPQMTEGMTVKDWNLWQEQWEDYALVYDITSKSTGYQAGTFRGCLGPTGREIYNGLPFGQTSDRNDIEKVLELFTKYQLNHSSTPVKERKH